MYKLILVSALIAVSYGGTVPEKSAYILGGQNSKITEVPYQVAIVNQDGAFFCGGAIISKNQVLTAAHCVEGHGINDIAVRAGISNRAFDEGVFGFLKEYVIHPKYDPETRDYDVAIIKVGGQWPFSKKIQPIGLATSEPEEGDELKVSGYGDTDADSDYEELVQVANIPAIGRETCAETVENLTERMICAGGDGKAVCRRDDGSPLTKDGELVGIVSKTSGCTEDNATGVFVNVADPEIAEFINENL